MSYYSYKIYYYINFLWIRYIKLNVNNIKFNRGYECYSKLLKQIPKKYHNIFEKYYLQMYRNYIRNNTCSKDENNIQNLLGIIKLSDLYYEGKISLEIASMVGLYLNLEFYKDELQNVDSKLYYYKKILKN